MTKKKEKKVYEVDVISHVRVIDWIVATSKEDAKERLQTKIEQMGRDPLETGYLHGGEERYLETAGLGYGGLISYAEIDWNDFECEETDEDVSEFEEVA